MTEKLWLESDLREKLWKGERVHWVIVGREADHDNWTLVTHLDRHNTWEDAMECFKEETLRCWRSFVEELRGEGYLTDKDEPEVYIDFALEIDWQAGKAIIHTDAGEDSFGPSTEVQQ